MPNTFLQNSINIYKIIVVYVNENKDIECVVSLLQAKCAAALAAGARARRGWAQRCSAPPPREPRPPRAP